MIITVASFKGGVGKTTTSIHLAAYLAVKRGADRVVLGDGDVNRSALSWADRGGARVPFLVTDGDDVPDDYRHLVIDTPARPTGIELFALAESSDLLVIPTSITPFAMEAAIATLGDLATLPKGKYRVLLTLMPPPNRSRGKLARQALENAGLPLFKGSIQNRTIYQDAELEGLPVNLMRGEAAIAAWSDYQAIGKEIDKLLKGHGK